MTGRSESRPDAAALQRLITTLEAAGAGDLRTDIDIARGLGLAPSILPAEAPELIQEGFAPEIAGELLDDAVAPYTRKLDAALPGENIVLVMYSEKRRRWAAVHRLEGGAGTLVWAASEPLARRLAVLKAMAAEPRGAAARPPATVAPAPAHVPAPAHTLPAPAAEPPAAPSTMPAARAAATANGAAQKKATPEPEPEQKDETSRRANEDSWAILF